MEATLDGPSGKTTLGPNALTIGRRPENQLLITDSQASGHHAEIRPEGQGYSIIDLGSTNGTFVNEQQLTPNVPRQLNPGDRIRIGQTIYTYEAGGREPIAPTVYVGPGKSSEPVYQPTVAAPPPTDYNPALNQQQSYQPPPPPAYSPAPAYQPYAPPAPQYAPPIPQAPPLYPMTPQKRSRVGLWIALGIIGVLLIGCISFAAVVFANLSTPEKTLTTFCDDLKKGDYHDAYQQLTASAQSSKSESDFTKSIEQVGGIKDCTYSNVNETGSTATAVVVLTVNLSSIAPITYDSQLADEDGTWKINSLKARTQ